MNRRDVMAAAGAIGIGALVHRPLGAAVSVASRLIFDRLLDGTLSASPQIATLFGFDTGVHAALKHRLDDRGPANRLNIYASFAQMRPALSSRPTPSDPRERQWLETARWFARAASDIAGFEHLPPHAWRPAGW